MNRLSIWPLIGLLLAASSASAQYFSRNEQHSFYNRFQDLRPQPDGSWVLQSIGDEAPDGGYIRLERVLPDGQTLLTLPASYMRVTDFDFLPVNGGYIITFFAPPCDLFLPRQLAYVDYSGQVLWSVSIDQPAFDFLPSKLLPGPGDSFWLFSAGNAPVRYQMNGDSIGGWAGVLPLFKGYRETADQKLLTYGPAGLALYSPSLNFIQQAPEHSNLLKAEPLSDGSLYALSADSLFLLDASFGVVQKIAADPATGQFVDMSAGASGVLVLKKSAGGSFLQRFSADLVLLETVTIAPDAPFQPELLRQDADRLLLAGAERAEPASAPQVSCIRATAANAPDFSAGADAGLDDVVLPKLPVGGTITNGWPGMGFSIILDSAYVMVRNRGAETLDSVTINAALDSYSFWCSTEEVHYQQTFTGLGIAPGETKRLDLGRIQWSNPMGMKPTELEFCFWTTLPNGHLDADHSNNRACRTASVTVGTHSPDTPVYGLDIFPNPVTETAIVRWTDGSSTPARVQVSDMTGRVLIDEQMTGAEWSFRRSGLPAGIYPVQVRSENGKLFLGKLMVE